MNTERIEELLERLIDKQDEIISRLDTVESVLGNELRESNHRLSNIEDELNWWEDKPTLAKQLLSSLEHIDSSLHDIDISITTSMG